MSKEIDRGEFWLGPEWFGIKPESRQHWQLLDKLARVAMAMGLDNDEIELYKVRKGLENEARPVGALLPVVKGGGEARLVNDSDKAAVFNLMSLVDVWPPGVEKLIEDR